MGCHLFEVLLLDPLGELHAVKMFGHDSVCAVAGGGQRRLTDQLLQISEVAIGAIPELTRKLYVQHAWFAGRKVRQYALFELVDDALPGSVSTSYGTQFAS